MEIRLLYSLTEKKNKERRTGKKIYRVEYYRQARVRIGFLSVSIHYPLGPYHRVYSQNHNI